MLPNRATHHICTPQKVSFRYLPRRFSQQEKRTEWQVMIFMLIFSISAHIQYYLLIRIRTSVRFSENFASFIFLLPRFEIRPLALLTTNVGSIKQSTQERNI